MKGLTQAVKPVSIPIKASSPKLVLSHLGIEITTKEHGSQRSFSKVMNILKKNASQWEAFFVSASCKKGRLERRTLRFIQRALCSFLINIFKHKGVL